uniref:Ig-like domain-containing protein n=1 Tax=Pundamilia nyererei TaxID=303518 RepID=A0A3B4GQ12_9CICH
MVLITFLFNCEIPLLLSLSAHVGFVVLSVCQVEVEQGAESVQLAFKTTENLPEDAKVEWRHYEPFRTVYVYQNGSDQPDKQDQVYVDRIQMNEDLLRTADLSLTLKQPTERDSGEYRCEVDSTQIYRYKTVLLKVKASVTVEGSESVILPCNTTTDLPEDTTVEWTRSDLGLITVHEYSNRNDELMTQDEVYRDRTKMNEDLLRTGDLSLTLKHPKVKDTGRYICTIYRDKDILTQKVVFLDTGHRSEIFFMLLHRTISILVQSFSGSPGSPGCSWGFWRSFFSFAAVFHVR